MPAPRVAAPCGCGDTATSRASPQRVPAQGVPRTVPLIPADTSRVQPQYPDATVLPVPPPAIPEPQYRQPLPARPARPQVRHGIAASTPHQSTAVTRLVGLLVPQRCAYAPAV